MVKTEIQFPLSYYQDDFHPRDFPMDSAHLRGALFGESFFSTMLLKEGRILFFEEHLIRLQKSWEYFYWPATWQELGFEKIITSVCLQLVEKYNITVPLAVKFFAMTKQNNGLNLKNYAGIYWDYFISFSPTLNLAPLKIQTVNGTMPVLANGEVKGAHYYFISPILSKAMRNGFDDILLFNNKNKIMESSTSRIIFHDGDQWETPDGVMLNSSSLKNFSEWIKSKKQNLHYKQIDVKNLKNYKRAYLINAVKGLSIIESIDDIKFDIDSTEKDLFNSYAYSNGKPI